MIHRAKVQYSNSATGEIQVIIPSVTSKTGTVPITMWGRESHAANSKWLVPAVGDTIVVCREDEDYTNVFWLNTTVPPDPSYTFVDTPGVDGDKTTHFGTMLQVETGNTGQVRINTSTNVGGAALVVQPWGTEGTGLYVNPSNNATTNRAAIQLGSSIRMGTGNTSSTLGDWYIYDQTATKYNLYHSGHSNVANGGLTVRATGTHTLGTAGTFERYIQFAPSYDWSGYERGGIFINNQYSDFTFFGTVYQYSCHPAGNNAYSLGYSGGRWSEVFAVNGTINTSDENQKTDIADSDLGLDFVNALRPVKFKWIETEGRAGVRTHYGLLGQEVETVLGGAASDTAIWTNALIEAHPAMAGDPERNVIAVPAVEEHYEQGLRYTELISPMIKAIQELTTRLAALESA
jgi:hypothetical protein